MSLALYPPPFFPAGDFVFAAGFFLAAVFFFAGALAAFLARPAPADELFATRVLSGQIMENPDLRQSRGILSVAGESGLLVN